MLEDVPNCNNAVLPASAVELVVPKVIETFELFVEILLSIVSKSTAWETEILSVFVSIALIAFSFAVILLAWVLVIVVVFPARQVELDVPIPGKETLEVFAFIAVFILLPVVISNLSLILSISVSLPEIKVFNPEELAPDNLLVKLV